MSRDKQIEDMAKEIDSEYDCVIPCQSCAYYKYANCRDVKSAEKLYNAGYRKSTDLAEEIFAEIDMLIVRRMIADIPFIDDRLITDIAKLKKKYTEVAERRKGVENSPVDCSTPNVTDQKGEGK